MNFLTIWLRIIKDFDISANDALVLEFIYQACHFKESEHPGWCYASKIYISEKLHIKMRSLYNSFNELENKGLIERDQMTSWIKTTTKYNQIHAVAQTKEEDEKLQKTKKIVDSAKFAHRVQDVHSDSAKFAVDGVQNLHTNIYNKDIYLNNIYKEFLFFDEEFQKVWIGYLHMRKKIKKPTTEYAEQLALKKLAKLSKNKKEDAIEIVNQSIMNSWQGLFPLKQNNNKKINDYSTDEIWSEKDFRKD